MSDLIRLMARRRHRHNVYFMARDLILGDGPEVRGAIVNDEQGRIKSVIVLIK